MSSDAGNASIDENDRRLRLQRAWDLYLQWATATVPDRPSPTARHAVAVPTSFQLLQLAEQEAREALTGNPGSADPDDFTLALLASAATTAARFIAAKPEGSDSYRQTGFLIFAQGCLRLP